MAKKDNLIWIDLEMTGLELENKIIEIASLVTDSSLNIIAEGPNIAIHQSNEILEGMDSWNTEQHTKSGLYKRVQESKYTEEEAAAETLDFLREHCHKGSCPLAGNSVHHDKNFLRKYMPSIVDFLHYRIVDVSSFKEMIRRWDPNMKPFAKQELHLALDDIRESVAELKYYRENYITIPD